MSGLWLFRGSSRPGSRARLFKLGKPGAPAAVLLQEAGMLPVRLFRDRNTSAMAGMQPLVPQEAGSVPSSKLASRFSSCR